MRATMLTMAVVLAASPAVAQTGDRAAIEAAAQTWLKHYEARDIDKLMTLFDDMPVVAINNRPALVGTQAVRGYFTGVFANTNSRMQLKIEDVRVMGKAAYLTSLYRLDGATKDGARTWSATGRSLLVYRKTPRGWLLAADMDNTTPDADSLK